MTPEERELWSLVARRLQPDADKRSVDEAIWNRFGETWAVMFTDLSGFSRRVAEFGIIHFLQIILEQRDLLLPVVRAHGGVVVKEEADSFLLRFPSAHQALDAALAMQRACQAHNADKAAEDQVLLCLGIGHGRVLRIGEHELYGQEVNAASKLGEDTAKANEILLTEAARLALVDRELILEDLELEAGGSPRNWRLRYID